ncbi:MAG: hypothetical protein AABZ39_07870 [Spirochaetota bacterium]
MRLLSALLLISGTAFGSLSVSNGLLLKDGRPYRAMGINYFSGFRRTVTNESIDTSYRDGFAALARHHIPFVRFAACGFWPTEWALYQTNKDLYFQKFDDFVKAAEQYDIGLIPSLFWRIETVPELFDEPHTAWGNGGSKTVRFMKDYVSDVVSRYRNSRSIWGWEFGNEFSLMVDKPNARDQIAASKAIERYGVPKRTEMDIMTSPVMLSTFREFADAVRRIDTTHIVITGNALPRNGAWHNTRENTWTTDTIEQFHEILARDNPDPYPVVSVHIYPDSITTPYFDKAKPASFSEIVHEAMRASAKIGKPLFVLEFNSDRKLSQEKEKDSFIEVMTAIENAGVPLSAIWVYDHPNQQLDIGRHITGTNVNAYKLRAIQDYNTRMIEK